MKWGRTDRPADQPQDGAVRDAARPGSYVRNVLGSCVEGEAASQLAMADRRVVKLRPVPQEPCRRREEPASVQGALRPGCPRGRSERRSNRCECVLRGDRWESKAQSFRFYSPGRLFGEQGSILCSRSRIRGTGILQVSRAGNSGKARNCLNYRPNNRANGRLRRGFWANYDPDHSHRVSAHFAAMQQQPKTGPGDGSGAYFRHSPRVRMRRTQRSSFRFRNATRVSASAFQRWVVWPLRPKPRNGCFSGGSVNP